MRSSLYSLRWLPVAFAISALTACGDAPTSNPLDVVHAFAGSDGAWSRGSLVSDGTTLFGRTAIGGAANSGTVFRIDGDGAGFAVLYSFSAGGSNVTGNQPHHNAMLLRDGTLIGAALYGGNQDNVQSDPVTGDLTSAAPPRPATSATARCSRSARTERTTGFSSGSTVAARHRLCRTARPRSRPTDTRSTA